MQRANAKMMLKAFCFVLSCFPQMLVELHDKVVTILYGENKNLHSSENTWHVSGGSRNFDGLWQVNKEGVFVQDTVACSL